MKSKINQQQLKNLLCYLPGEGRFLWRIKPRYGVYVGSDAGHIRSDGYVYITIKGKRYMAHRLAFLYMEGKFPSDEVDHINRNRSDNRWLNLRHSSRRINNINRSNAVQVKGVYWRHDRSLWRVYGDVIDGSKDFIGHFKTNLAACYARWQWEVNNDQFIQKTNVAINTGGSR